MDGYRVVGLPPMTPPEGLPAGERRMLEERELTGFLGGVYRTSVPDAGVGQSEPRPKGSPRSSTSPRSLGRPEGRPD